jgi:hypothetical protein
MTNELMRFLRRAVRQASWPLLQRYCVFPKVLDLPPVECLVNSDFSVHVLVCERDAIMLHWSLRSLHNHAKSGFQLYIHDDGSCSAETLSTFREKFVNSSVISRLAAYARVAKHIGKLPEIMDWWQKDYIAIKCIDFYVIGESKWVVVLDPDVIFFSEPTALFSNSVQAIWMQDCFYSLYIDPGEAQERFGVTPPQINAGLGRMPRSSIDLALLQEVLQFKAQAAIQVRGRQRHLPQYEDQTYHALLAARQMDHALFSTAYQVATEPGLQDVVAKHYTTPGRFWLYEEGIPRVARQLGLPLSRWFRERG